MKQNWNILFTPNEELSRNVILHLMYTSTELILIQNYFRD